MKILLRFLSMISVIAILSGCVSGGGDVIRDPKTSISPKGFRVLVYESKYKERYQHDPLAEEGNKNWKKFQEAIAKRLPEKFSEYGIASIVEISSALSETEVISEIPSRFNGSPNEWHYLIIGPTNAHKFCSYCPFVFIPKVFILDPVTAMQIWATTYAPGFPGPKPSLQGLRGKYFNVVDDLVDFIHANLPAPELAKK